jgi:serine/threonine-protein kinase
MLVGQRVGPFDVEKQLGSGAMGAVYQARYRKTGQRVALKVMAPGMGGNETALARFEREAEVLKQLNHPNIVRFYIASQFQGAPYYAMEYIEGESLDHILQRRERLTWEEVVELGRQICSALQHAHHHGIIHRDLKPSNLMITADGTAKLTDFGIAKDLDVTQLTAVNCTVGTASYMSPEQCRGERNLTHKSDLYSLGVLLYELLTGRRPFRAETTMEMFLQHVNAIPERPSRIVLDIPVWLDTLICQLLEKKPEHRPFDAVVVAQALDQVAEKVAAQQSAGVEVARARLVGRPSKDTSTKDTDHKTARTMLTGLKKGRRKRRTKPLYERVWFQAVAISVLLLAIVGILYLVFRAPRAEALFAQAQHLMATDNPAEITKARNGPIKDYLYYYPDRADAQSQQIRDWADHYDVALREQQLDKRYRLKLSPEGEAETQARRALNSEETGDWSAALEQWNEVAKFQGDPDADQRVWGRLARKRIEDLAKARDLEQQLSKQVAMSDAVPESKPDSDLERQAIKAFRYQMFGDFTAARATWQGLKVRCEQNTAQLPWFLLAAKQLQALKSSTPIIGKEGESMSRLQLIKSLLEKARAAGSRVEEAPQARLICDEIIDLYQDSPDPAVKVLVEQAQQLRDQLPGSGSALDRKR